VGPPGVGKTSLARSIASATGRDFVRVSLGGIRDEAEIRGHRRTYIGALPGKVIQLLKKAGTDNPVFLFDEIDKMSMDFRGDPASALLEVLDPEQNNTFNDHYLDLDYDLSKIMFITTANNISAIPIPLKDRMEVIELSGYTEFDKINIAKHFLIPKQLENNGLKDLEVSFTEAAISKVINAYTREAGVRNCEREFSSIFRKIAREVVTNKKRKSYRLTPSAVVKYLGKEKFKLKETEERDIVGLTNGMAWTMYGGTLLPSEVCILPGKGKLIITGKLGEVMQESAHAAMTYVRSRATNLGLNPKFYQTVDLHVHFPEAASPKDGPSAGITMATSIVSALTQIPVRHDVSMTGEITLRGRVLAIGGLKEKVLAAHRCGIKRIIIPKDNENDIQEIPLRVRRSLEFVVVENMDEVLANALQLDNPEALLTALKQSPVVPDVHMTMVQDMEYGMDDDDHELENHPGARKEIRPKPLQ
jgi:ATP-dependent Lon protease